MSLPDFRNLLFKALVMFFLILPCALSAKTVAFVGVQNLSQNPEYDYLAAFSEGVILFDLSSVKEITLVERNRLEKIIGEQRLQGVGFTGAGQEKESIEAGKLLAADYLVAADYTIINGEAAYTIRLIDTTTGAVRVFNSRGSTENDLHTVTESLARGLTGKNYSFINDSGKRSLLTLRDTEPGSIALYCNLVHAEILIDDKFAGYTTGNLYEPLSLPDLDPGTYTLKIRLAPDFGVIKLPEFTFSDWQEKVTVRAGRSTITKAVIYHFNDTIYKEMSLLDREFDITDQKPELNETVSVSFTDRQGRNIKMKVAVRGSRSKSKSPSVKCVFTYEGRDYSFELTKENDQKTQEVGKVRLDLKLETDRPERDRISIEIMRTDIQQNMFRGE